MKICPACGANVPDESKQCSVCGSLLPEGVSVPGQPVAQGPVYGVAQQPIVPQNAPAYAPPGYAPAYAPPGYAPAPGPAVQAMVYTTAGVPGAKANFAPPAGALPGNGAARNPARYFFENIFGIIILGVNVLVMLIFFGVALAGGLPEGTALSQAMVQIAVRLPLILGFALTIRACGPDFSLGAVGAVGALLYTATGSVPLAILAGLAVGAANGCLVYFLRLPSLITTMVTSAAVIGIAVFIFVVIGDGQMMPLPLAKMPFESILKVLYIVVAFLALGLCFVYNFFSPLGFPKTRKMQSNRSIAQFLAYPAAAFLASIAGVFQVMRIRSFAYPNTGFVVDPWILLLVWLALLSSKWFDNRIAPTLVATLMALITGVCTFAMATLGVDYYLQPLLYTCLALPLLVVVGIARWPFGKKSMAFPPEGQDV